jgi:hypothetical protein
MSDIVAGVMPWVPVVLIVIFLAQFYRSARILHVDGKFDLRENRVFGNASILPMFCVIGVLLIVGLAMERFPAFGPWGLLLIGVIVLIGTGWSTERGIRAVLAFRVEELEVAQRRARIAASREGSDIEWPK